MSRSDLRRWGASAAAWATVSGVAVAGIGALLPPYLLFGRLDPDRRVPHRVTNLLWGRLALGLPPWWAVEVRGLENLPRRGAYLLCANHQSMLDVLALHALGVDFKWVLHARFGRIPGFAAWIRSSGYVSVDPADPISARHMLDEVVDWLDRGVPVALFPEGTRSRDGEVAPMKRGPFRAALRSRCPVVPVAVDGTLEILPRGRWTAPSPPPWRIRVQVLRPITPAADIRAPALARECRTALAVALAASRGSRIRAHVAANAPENQ